MNPAGCPAAEVLGALLESDADEGSAECSEHLETCPCCQQTLADLAADGSTWQDVTRCLSGVEANAAGRSPTSEQALQRGLAQLKTELPLLLGKAAGESGEDLPLPSLQPADRPGVLGLLGSYEVLEVIGQGGMGVVLKAFDPALQRLVAIKVPAPVVAGSAHARRRFIREARAAAAVSHEQIVPVHGVEEMDGLPYLVMQFIEGESLQARLDRTGPLPVGEVVHIGLQTARGLAAAHAQGLIHRDIKPANLLLEGEPGASAAGGARVKISDFGLARLVDDVGLTRNGVVVGTPEYMAPEQARGELVDHRADLFSLGSVLYALCTGVPPFRAATPLAVLRQVSDATPPPVRSLRPEVPAWLEALITRLLVKDPADRYQSAAEVAALLEGRLNPLSSPEPGRKEENPGRARPSPRRLWLAALTALITLGLGFIALAAGGVDGKPAELHEVLFHDFRNPPAPPSFSFWGEPEGKFLKAEPEGMRITLPETYVHPFGGIGYLIEQGFEGDFEVTATVEVLHADPPEAGPPETGYGVGVILAVNKGDPARGEWASLGRQKRPQSGDVLYCHRSLEAGAGSEGNEEPCTDPVGKLRLKRTGTTLSYLWAPGPTGEAFRTIHQCDFGPEPIKSVRLTAVTGRQPRNVDVRLIDLRIRSGPASPPSALPKAKRWLLAAAAFGFILVLLSALGVLLHVRRRARTVPSPRVPGTTDGGEDKPGPAAPEAAAPFLVFPCPGCGKNLRARAALAGKSAKCPRCGQGVPVLETNLGSLAPGASSGRFSILKNRRVVASVLVLAVMAGVCSWLVWPRRDKGSSPPATLGNQFVPQGPDEDKAKNLAGWGVVTDPSGDCTFTVEESRLVVKVPGAIHNLNPNRGMQAPRVLKTVKGDFVAQVKVTGDFKPGEKAADQHSPFNSAGLLVWQDEKNYIRLERDRWYVPAAQKYACYPPLLEYYKNGAYQGTDPDSTLDEFFKGRSTWLRLERKGDKVIASYSHDGKEWAEAKEFTADLPAELSVGVAALNTSTEAFTVEFDEYKVEGNAGPSKDGEIRSGPASILPKGWLAAAAVAFGLLFPMALAAAWYERYRRRPGRMPAATGGQEEPTPSAVAAAPVAVSCPGCGKHLRARAELAGKKVKCPQCGQGVLIPETNPGSLAPPASTGRFSILKNRGVVASALVLAVVAGVCGWHFWPRPIDYSFLNGTLGNQFVPEVQESGLYPEEYSKAGKPFRWTDGKGRLVIPIDRRKPPTGLVVELDIFRPAEVKAAWVRIVANNRELIKQQIPLWDWQGASAGKLDRSFDLTGIDLGDELVLDIISDTYVPKTDQRTLGVVVIGIELRREAPAPR